MPPGSALFSAISEDELHTVSTDIAPTSIAHPAVSAEARPMSGGVCRVEPSMTYPRIFVLIIVMLAGSACASHSSNLRPHTPEEHGSESAGGAVPDASIEEGSAAMRGMDSSTMPNDASHFVGDAPGPMDSPATGYNIGVEASDPNFTPIESMELFEVEQDAATLYGDSPAWDPWEKYNRRVHRFNNAVDKYFLRPVATGYVKVVPDPVRTGVSRFFQNLGEPATAINQALQGDPLLSFKSLGRFAVNTTIGIGGVFDPASRMGLRDEEDEDFGQTFSVWGWRDSRYLVLPFLGPRTVRDTVSLVGDRITGPLSYINDSGTAAALQALDIVDGRARLKSFDEMRQGAYDDYVFVRDAWSQRRRHQIEQNARSD